MSKNTPKTKTESLTKTSPKVTSPTRISSATKPASHPSVSSPKPTSPTKSVSSPKPTSPSRVGSATKVASPSKSASSPGSRRSSRELNESIFYTLQHLKPLSDDEISITPIDDFIVSRFKNSNINELVDKLNKDYANNLKSSRDKLTTIKLKEDSTFDDLNKQISELYDKIFVLKDKSLWKSGKTIPSKSLTRLAKHIFDFNNSYIDYSKVSNYIKIRNYILDNKNFLTEYNIKDTDLNDFYVFLFHSYAEEQLMDYLTNSKFHGFEEKRWYTYRRIHIFYRVPLEPRTVWKALLSPKFNLWVDRMKEQKHIVLINLEITDIDMFGPVNVGFIKFTTSFIDTRVKYKLDPKTKEVMTPLKDNIQKGIVFMRGDAVAILVMLHEVDKKKKVDQLYVILTCQNRIPAGDENFKEIVAGMVDANTNNLAGVAAKEVEEETGLKINMKDTIDLGVMEPSMGGCDERIHLYAYVHEVTSKQIKEFEGKMTGNIEEGESITLKIVKYEDVLAYTNDAKAMCALYQYEQYLNSESE
jgi:8-oxo-dGTP pyrophosphatase MutT (NUDIX family)